MLVKDYVQSLSLYIKFQSSLGFPACWFLTVWHKPGYSLEKQISIEEFPESG